MIDKQIIESAKKIRKDYLSTTKEIEFYETDLKKLLDFLKEKMEKLETLKNTPIKRGEEENQFDSTFKGVLKELNEIENEQTKLSKKIDKMNDSLNKLKEMSRLLCTILKERYPEMSDDEMKKEIHKHLKE